MLHVISSLADGGAERQLAYLAAAQARLGLDVHVATLGGGDNLPRLERSGATIHWLRGCCAYDPRVVGSLFRHLQRVRPEVVQAWNTPFNLYCAVLCPVLRVPWVFAERSRGPWNPGIIGMPPLGYFVAGLRLFAPVTAAAVVANSDPARARWQRVPLAARCRHRTIPNIVPAEEIQSVPPVADDQEAAGRPLIVCAGRLTRSKNWRTAVRVLVAVAQRTDAVAAIFGRGPEAAALRAAIAEAGLGDRIRLYGYSDNLWGWLRRADVFLSLSRYEGHPNVVLEAVACGCPVVLSDIPAHRHLLTADQALLVPPAQVQPAIDAVLQVLDDPQAATARAAAAREICTPLRPEAVALQYEELYRELSTG